MGYRMESASVRVRADRIDGLVASLEALKDGWGVRALLVPMRLPKTQATVSALMELGHLSPEFDGDGTLVAVHQATGLWNGRTEAVLGALAEHADSSFRVEVSGDEEGEGCVLTAPQGTLVLEPAAVERGTATVRLFDGRPIPAPSPVPAAEPAAPSAMKYNFGDGVWHREDEQVSHTFGWNAGVLVAFGAEEAARYIRDLAGRRGLGMDGYAARTLLGSSRARFTVSGPAGRVAEFMAEIERTLSD